MSGKSGLGSIPILPQNLLAVKEENPKVFVARIVYILIYLILLALFIAYAVIALIEFLDAQENPALNSNVKGQTKMDYPVIAVCPYFGDYKIKNSDVTIGNCGSLEKEDTPQCGGEKKKEKKSKDLKKKLENCYNNKITQDFPTFDGAEPQDYDTYGCVILNLDKPYDDKIQDSIISDDVCNSKKPSSSKKNKKDEDVIEVAFAKGLGYADRLQFKITAPEFSIQTYSLVIKPSIEDFDIRTGEDAGNGFPEGSHIALFLKKVTFKCEECEDDQLETYFNTTVNILSLGDFSDGVSETRVEVYYDGLTVNELEEVITTTTLDYLGNFAGMLGTLLGFAVIAYMDRLLCYFIIGHGGMASVWDDHNQ